MAPNISKFYFWSYKNIELRRVYQCIIHLSVAGTKSQKYKTKEGNIWYELIISEVSIHGWPVSAWKTTW